MKIQPFQQTEAIRFAPQSIPGEIPFTQGLTLEDDHTLSPRRAASLNLEDNWKGVAQSEAPADGAIAGMSSEDQSLVDEMKQSRPDLGMADLYSPVSTKLPNGSLVTRNVLSPAIRDPDRRNLLVNRKDLTPKDLADAQEPDTLDLLKQRPDLTPKSLSDLSREFTQAYAGTSPIGGAKYAAQQSSKEAVALLRTRTDLKPSDLTGMLRDLNKAGGGGDKLPDMFSDATTLLTTRKDISPNQLGQMASSFKKSAGGPKEVPDMFHSAIHTMADRPDILPQQMSDMAGKMNLAVGNANAAHVPEMFIHASEALAKRPDIKPEQMGQLATQLGQGGLGSGAKGKDIAHAFVKSVDLLGDRADIKVDSVMGLAQLANGDSKVRGMAPKQRLQTFENGLDQLQAGKKNPAEALEAAKDFMLGPLPPGQRNERAQGREARSQHDLRGAEGAPQGAPRSEGFTPNR